MQDYDGVWRWSVQAQAVELLCRCDDIPDEGVELRVLKGLLTAVTSNTLHVHGQALLLVRACCPLAPKLQKTVMSLDAALMTRWCAATSARHSIVSDRNDKQEAGIMSVAAVIATLLHCD